MIRSHINDDALLHALAAEARRYGKASPIYQMRKALFSMMSIRVNGRVRRKSLLDAYFEKVNENAALGHIDAIRQINWINQFLAQLGVLHGPRIEAPELEATRDRLNRDTLYCGRIHHERIRICIMMVGSIRQAYQAAKPELASVAELIPYEWLTDYHRLKPEVEAVIARSAAAKDRKLRKKAGGTGVGYRKPPVDKQWEEGTSGNPSGRARRSSDVWETHRRAMMKIIHVKDNGRRIKSTVIALAVKQLFIKAMNGTRGAHRQVNKFLQLLHELNLLSAPPAEAHHSKHKANVKRATVASLLNTLWAGLLPPVKAKILAEYERVYGTIPAFTTALERVLARKTTAVPSGTRIRTRSRSPDEGSSPPTNDSPGPVSPRVRTRSKV